MGCRGCGRGGRGNAAVIKKLEGRCRSRIFCNTQIKGLRKAGRLLSEKITNLSKVHQNQHWCRIRVFLYPGCQRCPSTWILNNCQRASRRSLRVMLVCRLDAYHVLCSLFLAAQYS